MATLLFLGASVSQLPAIRFARAGGHWVVACDGDPNAVAFPYCDVAATVDFSDVAAVSAVAAEHSVEGVLAVCTDRAVVPAALVAEALGLPGLAPDVARAFTHKGAMRKRLALAGVPQPRSRLLTADSERTDYDAIPLPAVLKPVDSGGQRGLFRIDRHDVIEDLLPQTLAASRVGEAVLEEFVDGVEVNTLFVVREGVPTLLTISDRLRPAGAGFGVGWAHTYPTSLSSPQQDDIEIVAAAAIRALGMRDGIAFPQLIAEANGAVVVEVAARIAAGQMADLVRHATGIELYAIAIRQAIGKPVPDAWVEAKQSRPVAIRFLTASPGVLPTGVVRSISNLDDVRASPGVLDAGIYFGPGVDIGPLRVDADRRGYVVATGPTARRALELADAAVRKLRVEVEPVAPTRQLPRRRSVVLAAGAVAALAVGVLAWAQTRSTRTIIRGSSVTTTLFPSCSCSGDVAHIAFKLMRRSEIGVTIINHSGAIVARVLAPSEHAARMIHLAWNGRGFHGLVPDGRYYPDVVFPQLHRSYRLAAVRVEDGRT